MAILGERASGCRMNYQRSEYHCHQKKYYNTFETYYYIHYQGRCMVFIQVIVLALTLLEAQVFEDITVLPLFINL